MQILIFISVALALYAIWIARKVHQQIDNPPRSFHFTLQATKEIDPDMVKIQFYVLHLSGKKVFFDQNTFENINISDKIDTFAEIDNKRQIVCHSLGNALMLGYVTDPDKKEAEQGEELHLNILSLPQSLGNRQRIEKYFKESGWEIKRALSLNDIYFSKENLEVYITYIS